MTAAERLRERMTMGKKAETPHDPVTGEVLEGPRSFSVLLTKIDEGLADQELAAQLQGLVARMRSEAFRQNKNVKGELTFKLRFTTPPRGVLNLAYDIAVKNPKAPSGAATFWVTPGNNLTEHNPKQEKLRLREVDGPGDAREFDTPDERAAKEAAEDQRQPREI